MQRYFLLTILFFNWACTALVADLPLHNGQPLLPHDDPKYQDTLQIKYLGVGGFLIRRGKDAILTAPFFSNPSLLRAGLWSIRADIKQIDALLPPVRDVRAILIGHSHYDHLMDIPYIAQERAPFARIYGSETTKNILQAVLPEERLVALNTQAATHEQVGQWQRPSETRVRFMAIKSGHAPHLCMFGTRLCLKLYQGQVTQPLKKLPQMARGWKEGQTFSYLIDFLDDSGSVDFRIYYQDAASAPPLGIPPDFEPPDDKKIDVAILCVPGFNEVKNYPEEILRTTRPRFVVLAHWENFFRTRKGDPSDLQVVPGGTKPNDFIDRMQAVLTPQARWVLPRPGAWFQLAAEQSGTVRLPSTRR